jgi:nitroreductase
MEFKDVVKNRRSVRDYETGKEVTDEQLKELFDIVKMSPSGYNLQPWEFIVVRNPENKKRLRACAYDQAHVEEASATIIVLGTTDPSPKAEELAADRIKKGTMDDTKKKEFLATVESFSKDKNYAKIWTNRSTSLAAMTLMHAAKSMGLSTCPMEGFKADCIKEEFGIPEKYEVVMLITLGYESKQQPERPMRFGYEDIVHQEKF